MNIDYGQVLYGDKRASYRQFYERKKDDLAIVSFPTTIWREADSAVLGLWDNSIFVIP